MSGMADAELEFDCPSCAARLRVPASVAGRDVRCPACDHLFVAPAAPPVAAEIAAAPVGEFSVEAAPLEASVSPEAPPVVAEPTRAPPDDAQWWMRTPEGLNYGPATRATVERWVREGRVTGDCQLCTNYDPTWRGAESLFPALQAPTVMAGSRSSSPGAMTSSGAATPDSSKPSGSLAAQLVPHRGPLILTLGLVGLLVQCPLFSVMAWVMGSSDLDEMARGRMDPAGASLTRSGRMLGLVLSFAWIIMAVVSAASLIFYVAVRG